MAEKANMSTIRKAVEGVHFRKESITMPDAPSFEKEKDKDANKNAPTPLPDPSIGEIIYENTTHTNIQIVNSTLTNVHAVNTTLANLHIKDCKLTNVRISNCTLTDVRWQGTVLTDVVIEDCELRNVTWKNQVQYGGVVEGKKICDHSWFEKFMPMEIVDMKVAWIAADQSKDTRTAAEVIAGIGWGRESGRGGRTRSGLTRSTTLGMLEEDEDEDMLDDLDFEDDDDPLPDPEMWEKVNEHEWKPRRPWELNKGESSKRSSGSSISSVITVIPAKPSQTKGAAGQKPVKSNSKSVDDKDEETWSPDVHFDRGPLPEGLGSGHAKSGITFSTESTVKVTEVVDSDDEGNDKGLHDSSGDISWGSPVRRR